MVKTLHNETDSEILEQHKVAQDEQIYEFCDQQDTTGKTGN